MNHTTDEVQDISLSGSGTIAGGKYDRVKISGSGKISGDVEANELRINGSATVNGGAFVKDIQINGSVKFRGDVEGNRCTINGSASSDGMLNIANLSVNGSLHAHHIRGTKVKSSGSLDSEAVEAEEFKSRGSFSIDKELNAHFVHGIIYGSCYAKEIGGERIEIESFASKGSIWGTIISLFRPAPVLKSDIIEGTTIYLENTHAKVVRGGQIRIGPHCKIDRVEYMDTLDISPDSTVGEVIEG